MASEVAARLSGCPVLADFTDAEREMIGGYLESRRYAPDEVVVREATTGRDMYVVLDGRARITHAGVEVGTVESGQHFGEIGLVAQTPRAATITAITALEVAVLQPERFDDMAAAHPELALRLVRAMMSGLRSRLFDVTESVVGLLRERSLPRRARVRVTIDGQTHEVATGTPVRELLPSQIEGRPVVAALEGRRAVSLVSPIAADCTLRPITTTHWEGQRMWRRSLALLLVEAAHHIDPGMEVQLEHSVGYGQRVRVKGNGTRTWPELAAALQKQMMALVAADQELSEEWWTVEEALSHFAAQGWACAARLLDTWVPSTVRLVTYGQAYAVRMSPLLPSTAAMEGFQLIADEEGLLLVYGRGGSRMRRTSLWPGDEHAISEARAGSQHALTMVREHERWLDTLGITSIGEFNRACIDGDVSQLIRVAEGFQEKRISMIADEIHDRAGLTKLVCVAGPSSSGKTTFIRRLKVQLQVIGINPVTLGLDDYYVDRDRTPKDEDGELDFEALEAIDVPLLSDHVCRLLDGERVKTAHYDFRAGRGQSEGGAELTLGPRDVLMMEGIHGLNPRLLDGIGTERVFRIFICPLAQLPFDRASRVHASDVRLIRRIVRDRHGRGHDAAATIDRWPSVRRGERRHIFPFQDNADAVFDSSLIYELSVLGVFASRYLHEVPHEHPSFTTAARLLEMIDWFVTIYPDHVPPTSLLREFIGGSGFEY